MAFNKGNLIPTPVMRSDGHMTTVHKKSAVVSESGISKLAQTKPMASPAASAPSVVHANDKKMLKVGWRGDKIKDSKVLTLLGLYPEDNETGGGRMSHGELYDWMKLGMPLDEASYLNDVMPLSDWKTQIGFKQATPGSLAYVHHRNKTELAPVSEAIDFLRENGIAPRIAQKMLLNGFMDRHTKGVLDAEQLERLFIRFKNQPTVSKEDSNAAVAVDALVDGRLPWEAFTRDFARVLLTDAVDSLYPRGKRYQQELTDKDRNHLINNPDEIVPAMYVAFKSSSDFASSYASIKRFGVEACSLYSPQLMASQRSDGSLVGAEGARRVDELKASCNELLKGTPLKAEDYQGTTIEFREGWRTMARLESTEALDLIEAGASADQVIRMVNKGLNGQQMLSVVRGQSLEVIADGWL